MVIARAYIDQCLTADEVRNLAIEGLGQIELAGKRVLVIIPDSTRSCPLAMFFRLLCELIRPKAKKLDFLIALGTHPPMPDDLRRRSIVPGYDIPLGEHTWTIPVIRDLEGGSGLPRDWRLETDGSVSEIIQETYRSLWQEFTSVVDLFFSPDDPSPAGTFRLDRVEALRRCLDALAINYRIGRAEQNLLKLVNADNWPTILGVTVDLRTFWDVYQKTQEKKSLRGATPGPKPGSADTAPGPPADSPATGPAAASSSSLPSAS